MISHILLFITPWIILVLNQGSDGKIENLNSDEFRILSDKIESLSSALKHKDEQITKLEYQVRDNEIKIGNCLQKKESEFTLLVEKVTALERPSVTSDENSDDISQDNIKGKADILLPLTSGLSNKTQEERIEKLEELSKIKTLRSCHEYSMYGVVTSGTYPIDPDGDLIGGKPFDVYCHFGSDGEQAVTEVLHDQDFVVEIHPCPTPKCFELDVAYFAPMTQIETLKDISNNCYQTISFSCFLSALSVNDEPVGVWLNKDGAEETYFVGDNNDEHICSCGLTQDCSDSEHGLLCNCDAQIPVVQNDTGTITSQSDLPITGFRYGDMKYEAQFASVRIGRLKCEGEKFIEPTSLMDSCANLRTTGVTQSGHYILNDQSVVFCEMSKKINDPEIQRHIGRLWYNDILFVAVSHSGGHIPTGKIKFETEQIDVQDSFNKDTGIFQPPEDGLFVFVFNAYVFSTSANVNVYLNGDLVEEIYHNDDAGHSRQLIGFWTMDLKAKDQLYLDNVNDNSIYIGDLSGMYWMGFMLK